LHHLGASFVPGDPTGTFGWLPAGTSWPRPADPRTLALRIPFGAQPNQHARVEVHPEAKAASYAIAGGHGTVRFGVTVPGIYEGTIQLEAGVQVPEHDHAKSTEVLYILAGSGTMTIAGKRYPVEPDMAIQIPPGVKHSFSAGTAVRAVQWYTPSGPEQRFKAPPP
ncbi:MAG TPA: cupin domain-containing protein, partial [Kofleriaceae bacterium]|nr:cupin domain-containing protein [Kofleriaceae bacterium]